MESTKGELLYEGSVKNLRRANEPSHVVFEYSDHFSVFDWGRMPDELPGKGASLALCTAGVFDAVERPETWRDFLSSAHGKTLLDGASQVSPKLHARVESLAEEQKNSGM